MCRCHQRRRLLAEAAQAAVRGEIERARAAMLAAGRSAAEDLRLVGPPAATASRLDASRPSGGP